MKVLYFTHCCARKDDSLKGTEKRVLPITLYLATPTQRFMKKCIDSEVDWAIFSDEFAFVFPNDRILWYEKHPDTLSKAEKKKLLTKAFEVLNDYDVAYFYYNPGRIHPFHLELIDEMRKRGRYPRDYSFK